MSLSSLTDPFQLFSPHYLLNRCDAVFVSRIDRQCSDREELAVAVVAQIEYPRETISG